MHSSMLRSASAWMPVPSNTLAYTPSVEMTAPELPSASRIFAAISGSENARVDSPKVISKHSKPFSTSFGICLSASRAIRIVPILRSIMGILLF